MKIDHLSMVNWGQEDSTCHCWQLWRPRTAPAAGLATSGHGPRPCGGRDGRLPPRPPSSPAQSPELSCAVYLELAHRPTIRGKCALGWVYRPTLRVWWSSLVGGSISSLVCVFSGRLLGLWVSLLVPET